MFWHTHGRKHAPSWQPKSDFPSTAHLGGAEVVPCCSRETASVQSTTHTNFQRRTFRLLLTTGWESVTLCKRPGGILSGSNRKVVCSYFTAGGRIAPQPQPWVISFLIFNETSVLKWSLKWTGRHQHWKAGMGRDRTEAAAQGETESISPHTPRCRSGENTGLFN